MLRLGMAQKIPHILIFGTGSVGGYIGGRLIQAGQNKLATPHNLSVHIDLLARKTMVDHLKRAGLTLTHHSLPSYHLPRERLHSFDKISDCPRPDLIALCVKSQDTKTAAQQIKKAGWDAPIISWQNGVGNIEQLQDSLPGHMIIPAMVPFNITRPQPSVFHCGTGGTLHMGVSDHPLVELFTALMAKAGEPVHMTAEIEAYQWGKLIINLNNALNSLHSRALRAGFMDRDYRRALAASWAEALDIITASGITPKFFNGTDPYKFIRLLRLPTFIFRPLFARLIKMDGTARSSMLDDLEAGKASEIDCLQGAVIKLAHNQGRDAKVNEALYKAVQAAFDAGESPKVTGREIWERVGIVRNLL